ncbi:helix-turn-helix protein [Nitrospirillum viridazoti]|nr:helix-turn-helix protein [Nitrospirillum amazonense]
MSRQFLKSEFKIVADGVDMHKMVAMTQDNLDAAKAEPASRLKTARARLYNTAKQFAHVIGMPYTTYAHYEAGRSTIDTELAQRFAPKLNVSAAWLLLGDGEDTGQAPEGATQAHVFGMPVLPVSESTGLQELHREMGNLIRKGHYAMAAIYADLLAARLRLADMAKDA